MSMRRIIAALVRHGDYQQPDQVPSAQLPHPLTERGVEQAQGLGATLHEQCQQLGLTLDPLIDCSTLLRASQTASLAAEVLNRLAPDQARPCSIAEFPRLGERSVGAGANLTVQAIAQAVAQDPRHPPLPDCWKTHPRFCLPLPGAESLMMAGARVAAHIEGRVHELRSADGPDLLKVFISHGGALRHAAVCMGTLALDEVPGLSMHHCGYVLMEHSPDPKGGVGRWHKVGGHWKVRATAKAVD